jgi:hypothetical protein
LLWTTWHEALIQMVEIKGKGKGMSPPFPINWQICGMPPLDM